MLLLHGRRASRVSSQPNCVNESERDAITMPVIQQQEITIGVTMPAIETLACNTTVSLNYMQSNDVASVDGIVANDACAASSGSFVVTVSIKDGDGNLQRQEFMRSWQRADDQDVTFSAEYPIGTDVDLVRVTAGRARCRCEASQ